MAKKKPRTPSPPRKVQAPKVRQKHSAGSGISMPSTNVLGGIGIVVVAGLAIALITVLAGRGGGAGNVSAADVAKARTAMTAAGCTFQATAAEARNQHMATADEKVTYATFPPTSGVHNPSTAFWGNYRTPADPRQVVHNEEHGGIVVWYGPGISAKDRGELDSFYDDDPNGIIVTPLEDPYPGIVYPKHEKLGSKIALTVWTARTGQSDTGTAYIAVCPSVDRTAFEAFRDAFRGKGPERSPVSRLSPGGH